MHITHLYRRIAYPEKKANGETAESIEFRFFNCPMHRESMSSRDRGTKTAEEEQR